MDDGRRREPAAYSKPGRDANFSGNAEVDATHTPIAARNLRAGHVFLRRNDIFVRSAPGAIRRVVRSGCEFAHFARPPASGIAPFARNVAGRRSANRRKCTKRTMPRAH